MNNMDKQSVEYAKLQAIQADYLLQIEIDKTKEKEKQNQNQKDDAQAKLADLKSQKANLHKSDYMPTPDQIRKSRKFGGIQRDIDFLTGQATNALLEGNQDLANQAKAQIEGYDVPLTPWQEAQNKAQEDLNKKMGFHHDIPFKRHIEGLKETLANAGLTPQDMSISNIDRNISDLLKKASIDGIKLSDK
jgi:FtsZ-binding cell division protein ZapB